MTLTRALSDAPPLDACTRYVPARSREKLYHSETWASSARGRVDSSRPTGRYRPHFLIVTVVEAGEAPAACAVMVTVPVRFKL